MRHLLLNDVEQQVDASKERRDRSSKRAERDVMKVTGDKSRVCMKGCGIITQSGTRACNRFKRAIVSARTVCFGRFKSAPDPTLPGGGANSSDERILLLLGPAATNSEDDDAGGSAAASAASWVCSVGGTSSLSCE